MSKNHYTKSELKEYEKIEKTCKQCGTKFYKTWSKWTLSDFCCQKCARAYSTSSKREEINKKVSEKLKSFHDTISLEEFREKFLKNKRQNRRCKDGVMTSDENKNHYYSSPKICPICNNIIPYERRARKTCSKECGGKAIVQTKLDKGYYDDPNRHFVTSKCGYYKGIYCGSTYELVYTIYNLDHNIPFERNKKGFPYKYKGRKHTYYPDYITPDGYVEIKGMWTDKVDAKLAAVDQPIKILYKKDLKYAFDYVSDTYLGGKKSGWQSLYDNHRPKYSKVCPECGVTFDTESKRVKFCTHYCSVKYNSRKRIGKQNNCKIRTGITPEGFVAIPKLDGYFINNEKKVWSNAKGGHFMRLYNMRGRRNKYNIKNVWYTPDELFNMTFKQ